MTDTGSTRRPRELDRIAATEYQPWPAAAMVRGEVHDENAWSLGGVAGHAGLFSTADDLAVLAQTCSTAAGTAHARILSATRSARC